MKNIPFLNISYYKRGVKLKIKLVLKFIIAKIFLFQHDEIFMFITRHVAFLKFKNFLA